MNDSENQYPPIEDYALISDCRCTALISRSGSIDWCCMPNVDSDSCFGRMLDWNKGGFCSIVPVVKDFGSTRRYLPDTMILETNFVADHGAARLYDFYYMDPEGGDAYNLVRLIEGVHGEVKFAVQICPRFDYGEIIPRFRERGPNTYSAVGSNKGLIFRTDIELRIADHGDLEGEVVVGPGQRVRLDIQFALPEAIEDTLKLEMLPPLLPDGGLERTREAWGTWAQHIREPGEPDSVTVRSAIVLKALTVSRSGAIVAAPTTSLPEWVGGMRNWDYRFSWVRDSVFTVQALYQLGCEDEAEQLMRFIQRSSAGSAAQLQIMYGVDGKRRLTEVELGWLDGYRGSNPVRIGNFAAKQTQLDVYGEIMELAWQWRRSGHDIEAHYWDFLSDVVDRACAMWQEPDYGIWEIRDAPRHHVYSKAMCWAALNYGIQLAKQYGFEAPLERWTSTRDAIQEEIEAKGYDKTHGVYYQAFENRYLDSALLLLPRTGYLPYDDPRMVRTADAIRSALETNGLLARYDNPDGVPGNEGVFLPCTFWLARCLAYQNRVELARSYYERAARCANDLGLFSEEYDTQHERMLGNFPQALTHVSQIMAQLALAANECFATASERVTSNSR